MKPIKLGKRMKLKYIPFSELVSPRIMVDTMSITAIQTIPKCNSRSIHTIKTQDIEALMISIKKYGLMNPLTVWQISTPETPYENSHNGKYAIIDGQRRYFAIKLLFNLHDEMDGINARMIFYTGTDRRPKNIRELDNPSTPCDSNKILIPCLIYNYENYNDCLRHSIEDNKFSITPSSIYLDCAERMTEEDNKYVNQDAKPITIKEYTTTQ